MFFRGDRNVRTSTYLAANSNLNTSSYLRVPFGGYRFQLWGTVDEAGSGGAGASATPGQNEYVCPGTYSWVAPSNVTCVSAVVIGAGGPGSCCQFSGSGGGLAYSYCIPVTPGASYTVCVGAPGYNCNGSCSRGGCSFFKDASTLMATGGGPDASNMCYCNMHCCVGCGVAGDVKTCGGCGCCHGFWDYKFYNTCPIPGGPGPHYFCTSGYSNQVLPWGVYQYAGNCYAMNTGGIGTGIWFGKTGGPGYTSCNACRYYGGACTCGCTTNTCGWLWYMTETGMPTRLAGAACTGGCCGYCYFCFGCPYSGGGWGSDIKGCFAMSSAWIAACVGGGNGGQFGGGGGGKHAYGCYCCDTYSPGLGGGGAVRIIWGNMINCCRVYPCCNTYDV